MRNQIADYVQLDQIRSPRSFTKIRYVNNILIGKIETNKTRNRDITTVRCILIQISEKTIVSNGQSTGISMVSVS